VDHTSESDAGDAVGFATQLLGVAEVQRQRHGDVTALRRDESRDVVTSWRRRRIDGTMSTTLTDGSVGGVKIRRDTPRPPPPPPQQQQQQQQHAVHQRGRHTA